MPVNNKTCRVGSNTACQQNEMSCWVHTLIISMYVYTCTCMSTTRHVVLGPTPHVYNQHVGLFVHACQQYDMSCWVQHTCYNQHVCLYMYMHVNNTTYRVGSNTICYNQHVCLFVHAYEQRDMSCCIQHHLL
jgi:hypothetical protein